MIARVISAAALVAACLVILLPAPSAHACSCAIVTAKQYARYADAVFTGTLDEPQKEIDSGRQVAYRVNVADVWKGKVEGVVTVTSGSMSSACGLPYLPEDVEILWFATNPAKGNRSERTELSTGLCSGTRPTTSRAIRVLTAELGQPSEPSPVIEDPPMTDNEGRYDDLAVGLIVAAVVVGGGAAAYLLIRRRRALG